MKTFCPHLDSKSAPFQRFFFVVDLVGFLGFETQAPTHFSPALLSSLCDKGLCAEITQGRLGGSLTLDVASGGIIRSNQEERSIETL